MCNAQHADEFALAAIHRCFGRFKQTAVTAIGKVQPFFVAARVPGGLRCQVVGAEEIGQFVGNKIVVGLTQNVGFGVAVKAFKAGVAGQIHTVGVFQPHQIGNGLHQRFEKAALVLQGHLGLLARSDVNVHAHKKLFILGVARNGKNSGFNPYRVAILVVTGRFCGADAFTCFRYRVDQLQKVGLLFCGVDQLIERFAQRFVFTPAIYDF